MSSNSKVFLIIGKSFSGKSTLLEKILADKEFCDKVNLHRLMRYTTRKPRANEVEGSTNYHFIDDEEYEEKFKNNPNAVTTSFQSKYGLLHYIINLDDMEDGKNYITDADPKYIKPLKDLLGNRLALIYLMPPDWVLFKRFLCRGENEEYDYLKYQEIYRRYMDDLQWFAKESNAFATGCNCICVLGQDYSINIITNHIEYIMESIDYDYKTLVFLSPGYDIAYDNSMVEKELPLFKPSLSNAGYIRIGKFLIDTNDSKVLEVGIRYLG